MRKPDEIDALISVIEKKMPDTVYLMRNPERYDTIVSAMGELRNYIATIEDDATFKVTRAGLVGEDLALDVTCTLLAISEVDRFCNAIKVADTIDVEPLTNGDLHIVFGFKHAYVPAPAYGTPEAIEHNKKFSEQQKKSHK